MSKYLIVYMSIFYNLQSEYLQSNHFFVVF